MIGPSPGAYALSGVDDTRRGSATTTLDAGLIARLRKRDVIGRTNRGGRGAGLGTRRQVDDDRCWGRIGLDDTGRDSSSTPARLTRCCGLLRTSLLNDRRSRRRVGRRVVCLRLGNHRMFLGNRRLRRRAATRLRRCGGLGRLA